MGNVLEFLGGLALGLEEEEEEYGGVGGVGYVTWGSGVCEDGVWDEEGELGRTVEGGGGDGESMGLVGILLGRCTEGGECGAILMLFACNLHIVGRNVGAVLVVLYGLRGLHCLHTEIDRVCELLI